MIYKSKDDSFVERTVWCMFSVVVGCFLIFAVLHKETNDESKDVPTPCVNVITEFSVYYKDGHVVRCKASSVIYGVNDDKIYFLGQTNDTLQILPKVMVEDIQEISTKIKK